MTVDLGRISTAVPRRSWSVSGRPARPGRGPREPGRRYARGIARRRPAGRALGGRADRSARIAAAAVRLPAGVGRVRTDPDPAAPYDLIVIVGLRRPRPDRRASASAMPTVRSRLPRVVIDHHASNDAGRRGPLDRSARGRDVRDGGAARRRLGSRSTLDDGALADRR